MSANRYSSSNNWPREEDEEDLPLALPVLAALRCGRWCGRVGPPLPSVNETAR